jgi:hypothetical protein
MPDNDPAHEAEAEYVDRQDDEWRDGELPNTFPSGDTVRADRADAEAAHQPDPMPGSPPMPEPMPTPGDPGPTPPTQPRPQAVA